MLLVNKSNVRYFYYFKC